MKAKLKVTNNLIIEVEGDDQAELFENLSHGQEVFQHTQCGVCKETHLRFAVRKDDEDNKYYELHCTNNSCRARLPFGQSKKGGNLYPKIRWDSLSDGEKEKRKDEEAYAGKHYGYLPNSGWYKYVKPEAKKG